MLASTSRRLRSVFYFSSRQLIRQSEPRRVPVKVLSDVCGLRPSKRILRGIQLALHGEKASCSITLLFTRTPERGAAR